MPAERKKRKPDKSGKRTLPDVGERMRLYRERSGLSMDELVEKIHISKGHISMSETGKRVMSLPFFLDFCRAIKTPPGLILESEFEERARENVRLATALAATLGIEELRWLATLDRIDARLAMERAHEAVAWHRAQVEGRRSAKIGGSDTDS